MVKNATASIPSAFAQAPLLKYQSGPNRNPGHDQDAFDPPRSKIAKERW